MDGKRLIICDPEREFALAFGEFLSRKKELSLQIEVCSDLENARGMTGEKPADFLIISGEFPCAKREEIKAGKTFVLTGDGQETQAEGEVSLYKYQPGERLLEEMLREWGTQERTGAVFRRGRRDKTACVIGVFSPVHRIGKTAYALRIGEEMAAAGNALYLNLEVYGGIGGHFEEGGRTMADLLYYARQEQGNLGILLAGMVKHRRGLDYILPMPQSEDVKEIRAKEWADLTLRILEESIYDTLILDIDEAIPELPALLEICTQIHMLEADDPYSQAKIRQFQEEMHLLGREDILEKIVYKRETL